MSALLAVATTVATSVPSPEVVVKTVQVAVTPEWVKELASLALLTIPGYAASWVHSLVNDKKDGTNRFAPWFNAALLFVYSAGLAVLAIIVQGGLNLTTVDWGNPDLVVGSFFTVLGAAAARYAYLKARYGTKPEPEVATVQNVANPLPASPLVQTPAANDGSNY